MEGSPHGSSSALQKDVLWVRYHRITIPQELWYANQVHPDSWSVVDILEDQGSVDLPPERKLDGANAFGFNWISRCV